MSVDESRHRRAARTTTGARLGEYVLERALGQGAMGSVFVGRHSTTGARHALKVLHLGASPERRERFAREARALAKVDRHPGVIRIHRYDVEEDGLAYCALDLVEGSDLEHLLAGRAGAGLPLADALALGEGLARALAHVHAAGIVHRDLKPANVLLPSTEGALRPVLTDFGVARDEVETRLTVTQQLVGTPHYMAPEQVMGEQGRVGPPTDVFALGVVLYQLLTGRLPFDGGTLLELTSRICGEDPPPPRRLRRDLSRDLERVVLLMLEKEPARRPTAATVAEWLAGAAAGERLTVSGGSALARGLRRGGGRRLLGAGAVALALAGAVALALAGRGDPAREEARAAALAGARSELERARQGLVERLVSRVAPDVAALGSARAALVALDDDDARTTAALEALDRALAGAAVEEALARGEVGAARERLERLGPAALGSLEVAVSAREGQETPLPEAQEARVLVADAALSRGDVAAAQRLLAEVREPALAPARRLLEVRLDLLRAEQAAARLDGPGAVGALKAAAARDAAAGAAGVARVAAAAVASDDPARAVVLLRALRAGFPEAPLAGAARPFHALALAALEAKRFGEVVALVDAGWLLDPDTPPPMALAAVLAVEANAMIDGNRPAEGYAVLLHAVRAGRADPMPMERLVALRDQGVLDGWVRRHPGDWAGRYIRADAVADGGFVRRERLIPTVLEDVRLVLARPDLPAMIRPAAELLELEALVGDPGYLARLEALYARGHLHAWRLCQLASAYHQNRDEDACVEWSRRSVREVQRRIDQIDAGTLDVGSQEYFDGVHQLNAAYERLLDALLRTGRKDEAQALLPELERSVLRYSYRVCLVARIHEAGERWPEAAEAAAAALDSDPDNKLMQRIAARAAQELGRQR
jgi:serine/threonine-protein kinase